ncbi:uncharacterized protein CAALFM_C104440WA [Candida albicans SC5314]|uniref:Uncharacterized protein n=1 Tax=Candida albicans (strain SC5314 / ATCC MYA-2876) TaxID=237561 RepID=Q59KZ4_CANAL|nr:uncharacterized protein CAALFM_C104440WA [Candida albicans SC5314]AOW26118.1 hypothetical protein CAALFM_C104440WA [Candida albicans SC5314]|eukprot:XP_710402.1 hypothetical protein CAALFM_C104440WA [Candida albicans SC5314]
MTLPLVFFKCGKSCFINSTTANKLISYNLFQSSTEVDSIGPTGSKTPAFAIIEFNCPNFEIASLTAFSEVDESVMSPTTKSTLSEPYLFVRASNGACVLATTTTFVLGSFKSTSAIALPIPE